MPVKRTGHTWAGDMPYGYNAYLASVRTRVLISKLKFDNIEYDNKLAYKTYFTQEMLKKGFLAATAVYASYAHTDEIIDKYLRACKEVFENIVSINNKGENIEKHLQGPICHAGFERLN